MQIFKKYISHHLDVGNTFYTVPLFQRQKGVIVNLSYYWYCTVVVLSG